jgi:hypothetical protein
MRGLRSFASVGLVVALSFFSSPALALNTTWYNTSTLANTGCNNQYGGSACSVSGTTAMAACRTEASASATNGPANVWRRSINGASSDMHNGCIYGLSTTCTVGANSSTGQCITCTASSGTRQDFSGPSGGIPLTVCHNNCTYNSTGVGLSLTGGSWSVRGTSTGSVCSTNTAGVTAGNAGTNCVTSSTGKQYCQTTADTNCGTVNGAPYCVENMPATSCTVVGGVGYICDDGSPASSADDAPTPTGSPGPREPVGTSQTYTNGSPTGTATEISFHPPSSDGNSPPAQDSSVKEIPKGQCGAPGFPKCKIDEEGTPEADPNAFDNAANGTGINELISGIGADSGVSSASWTFAFPSHSSSCDQITWTYKNAPFAFPSSSQCSVLNTVKSLIAWFLFIVTGFLVYEIATRRPV